MANIRDRSLITGKEAAGWGGGGCKTVGRGASDVLPLGGMCVWGSSNMGVQKCPHFVAPSP